MLTYTHSWLAVIITAVGCFIIGFLWFGPLFGKTWIRLMGISQAQAEEGRKGGMKSMVKPMIMAMVSNLVTAFVFFTLAQSLMLAGFASALMLGILLWLGFSIPLFLNGVLWEKKSWSLFWFNAGHILVTLIFSALVYSFWR
ncbi:DUF1761 domain-containing protein [Candidatus Parcubacteria bacterium]|nr:DUF1761 domain-containing protein [Candidatus Parcubacteria bacterium]